MNYYDSNYGQNSLPIKSDDDKYLTRDRCT